ncbi:MAG: glycosyltransferase [Cyclobacteriaceae bacterium]|nr:glycosyltransferase [Cyclobacteriaceae bacterium SS2]
MKVSIILPNYNHAVYLDQRISGILRQSLAFHELIILDDCSLDGSVEVIRKYLGDPRIKFIQNDPNSGSTFLQWKKGLELVSGDLVWIAESDDDCEPDFLAKLVPPFEKDGEVTLAFCDSAIIDENSKPFDNSRKWSFAFRQGELLETSGVYSGKSFCEKYLSEKNVTVNASGIVFRKSTMDQVGGPDTSLKMAADWRLWFELCLLGKIHYVNESLNHHRRHQNTVTHQKMDILKKESFQNQNHFYRLLRERKASTKWIRTYRFKWAFKKAIWEAGYVPSIQNFRLYFTVVDFSVILTFLTNLHRLIYGILVRRP